MTILDWSIIGSIALFATGYFEEQSHEKHFRQRSLKFSDSEEEEEEEKKKKIIPLFHRPKASSRNFNLIRNLLFILISITFVFILYSSLSLSPLLRFLDSYSYVLVLDVGSTGTHIHVYNFRASTDNDNGNTFVLKNEVFKERKPGLSSFADHVDQAEDQINELLKIADKEVSRFKHRSTPLVLCATAGLKLLNETKQYFKTRVKTMMNYR